MKFQTPAFVRVENPQERKEMTEWLEGIGYKCVYGGSVDDNLISCYGDSFGVDYKSHMGCYDCDTNIPLFKALAAMNDENDREQILTDGSRYIVCHLDNFHEYPRVNICTGDDGEHNIFEIVKTENWRKATFEEIINHFKNQKS